MLFSQNTRLIPGESFGAEYLAPGEWTTFNANGTSLCWLEDSSPVAGGKTFPAYKIHCSKIKGPPTNIWFETNEPTRNQYEKLTIANGNIKEVKIYGDYVRENLDLEVT
jgi:hypothetical protein